MRKAIPTILALFQIINLYGAFGQSAAGTTWTSACCMSTGLRSIMQTRNGRNRIN